MYHKNYFWSVAILSCVLALSGTNLYAGERQAKNMTDMTKMQNKEQAPQFPLMPDPGDKVPIGNGHYLIYGFVKQPKMGMVIFKVQVFDSTGKKDKSYKITADSWMPSMPNMHSGHGTCRLNKRGDYLVPIDITMPGDWEVKLTVKKDGKIIYRGAYRFDV